MQISNRVVVYCAAGLILAEPIAFSADNPDQVKARQALEEFMSRGGVQSTGAQPRVSTPAPAAAVTPPPSTPSSASADEAREALRRKMAELDAASPSATQAPSAPRPPAVTQPPTAPQPPPVAAPATRPQPSTARTKEDSEAIARAREAVRQKVAEMQAQEQQAATQTPAVTQQPQVVPQQAPVVQQPAPQQAPALQQPAAQDPAAIEKARELLRQKMAELEAQQPSAASPAARTIRPPVADSRFSDLSADEEAARRAEAAREALRRQMESLPPEPPVVTKAPEPKPEKPAKPAKETPEPQAPAVAQEQAPAKKAEQPKTAQKQPQQYKALQAPALPFSEDQQAKLAELLKRYRADEITPEQYHAERAKIIGNR